LAIEASLLEEPVEICRLPSFLVRKSSSEDEILTFDPGGATGIISPSGISWVEAMMVFRVGILSASFANLIAFFQLRSNAVAPVSLTADTTAFVPQGGVSEWQQ
jgi:hypothetical protein